MLEAVEAVDELFWTARPADEARIRQWLADIHGLLLGTLPEALSTRLGDRKDRWLRKEYARPGGLSAVAYVPDDATRPTDVGRDTQFTGFRNLSPVDVAPGYQLLAQVVDENSAAIRAGRLMDVTRQVVRWASNITTLPASTEDHAYFERYLDEARCKAAPHLLDIAETDRQVLIDLAEKWTGTLGGFRHVTAAVTAS